MSNFRRLIIEAGDRTGYIRYIHGNAPAPCCAFLYNEKNSIRISIPRALGASAMFIEVFRGEDLSPLCVLEGELISYDGGVECYGFDLSFEVGLYFAQPKIKRFSEELYGRKVCDGIVFDGKGDMIQFSISDFLYERPEDIYGGIIYHIFVDRFARGGKVKQPDYAKVIGGEWDSIPEYPEYPGAPLANNTFYGGNLYGIIDKLEYIASLGTTALYLSPIFESVSNHKYDTADYMKVDQGFGGDRALQKLIDEAGKFGIKIILDGVFNHTGSDSVYFNRKNRYDSLGAYQSKTSQYFDWYDFKEFPDSYTCWWDIEILPRINPDKSSCGDYFVGDGGVISKYRDMGIYGIRLDVADELSDEFIGKIKSTLSKDGESILYGEVWEDASNKIAYDKRKRYYLGSELDGVMNYPLREGLIEYVTKKNVGKLSYVFDQVFVNSPTRILNAQMNFLGTHDTKRILTILGGDESYGKTNAELSVLRMSPERREYAEMLLSGLYTVLATLPGIPTVFYGDEAGLEGYSDPFNRMPYPWGKESRSLISHYRNIGRIRRENPVYKEGAFRLLYLDENTLIFERVSKDERFITVYNNSNYVLSIEFSTKTEALVNASAGRNFKVFANAAEIFKVNKETILSI